MGEGARTGSCPFAPRASIGSRRPLRASIRPSAKGVPAPGLESEMTAPGPSAVAEGSRVPASTAGAGRGEAGALSGYSPRPRRRRLFRASWPRSGPAGRRRPPPPAPRPAPRARAPRPLTCHRRRLAQHQPPTLPLRGQRERERQPRAPRPPPAPSPAPRVPRPPRAPTFLPSRSLTWPSTSAASVIFCHGSRAPAAPLPAAPRPPSPGSLSK